MEIEYTKAEIDKAIKDNDWFIKHNREQYLLTGEEWHKNRISFLTERNKQLAAIYVGMNDKVIL